MARLSLWNPKKGNDYKFIDKTVKGHFDHGGTSLLIHKYIGSQDKSDPEYDASKPAIQDLLFLENRDRKYDADVYDLRVVLTQDGGHIFGVFVVNNYKIHKNTKIFLVLAKKHLT